MNRSFTHGTLEQFQNAIEDKIAELTDSSIDSSTDVNSSTKKTILSRLSKSGYTIKEVRKMFEDQTGLEMTPDHSREFNEWAEDFLRSIKCSTNIKASTNLSDDEIERYYHTLIGEIESELSGEFDNIVFNINPNNDLEIIVTNDAEENAYIFTPDEFTFDWTELNADSSISADVYKVLDTIRDDFDYIESSTEGDYGALDENEIIEWLGEHEQAWEDFTAYFSEYDINKLSDDEIIGWIYEHDLLFKDFCTKFPDIAAAWLDPIESSTQSYDSWEEAIIDVLGRQGYNTKTKTVRNYAEAAAALLNYSGDMPNYISALDWYNETAVNYPEDLEELPRLR